MTPTKAPPNLVAAGVIPNLSSYAPSSDFTRPVNPIVECPQPQKYISRRKQRRWENANMIILHRILNSSKFQTSRDTHSSANAIHNQFSLLKIDGDFLLASSSNHSKRILRQDEFMKEEALWIANVKKQLRPVVEDLLQKRLDLVEFLKNIEYLIALFIDTQADFSLEGEALDESFLNLLQRTCSEDDDSGLSNIESQVFYDREDSKLCIRLQDLPLHRLIVFATCQFYGLHVEKCYNYRREPPPAEVALTTRAAPADSKKPSSASAPGGRRRGESIDLVIWFPRSARHVASSDLSLLRYLVVRGCGQQTAAATDA